MHRLTLLLFLALVAGCGDNHGPVASGYSAINGTWHFRGTASRFAFVLPVVQCNIDGTVTVMQKYIGASGQYSEDAACSDYQGHREYKSASGSLINVAVAGRQVSFATEFCTYSGALNGEGHLSGTVLCAVAVHDVNYGLSGIWSAQR